MKPQQSGGAPSAGIDGATLAAGAVILFAIMAFIANYRPLFSTLVVTLNQWELWVIGYMDSAALQVLGLLDDANKSQWSYEQLYKLNEFTGEYLRWPVAALLITAAVWVFGKSPKFRFRRILDMNGLLRENARTFPAIRPIINRVGSLLDEPLHSGPWRVAQHPIEWALAHEVFVSKYDQSQRVREEGFEPNGVIPRQEHLRQLFVDQLGGYYERDLSNLYGYERALAAAFIARGCGDFEGADRMLAQLSTSFREGHGTDAGTIDSRGADKLLAKHLNNPAVQHIIDRHAFRHTVLRGLLQFARTRGVLTTADCIWVRPTNRHLWMALNSLGGRTSPIEAAGVFAHYQAEEVADARIYTPDIEQAVDGFLNQLVGAGYITEGAAEKDLSS